MLRIPIDMITPGMRLAEPVTNKNGLILINEGTELTETIIEKLKNMDLQSLRIKGESGPSNTKEEMLAALDERFKRVKSKPLMITIKNIIKEHIEELYGSG
ncbi:MAG: hypothetical protein KBE27_03600 [Syntrophorhabdaceae bacterium]|nr:hypothetical protein [Syntrophorhabdaceae bacterium]